MLHFVAKTAGLILLGCCFFLLHSCTRTQENGSAITLVDSVSKGPTNPYQSIDQSPLDISYCPAQYPQRKMKGEISGGPVARVIYSRPHRKGRTIFSDDPKSLCPYGKPWRLGANEATEIEFFKPVMILGKNVEAGRYIVYCIPHADKWQIVLNRNLNSWGLGIDASKDVLKLEAPVQVQEPTVEDFTMLFQDTAEGADLLMSWDNVKVQLPLTFAGL
jgi:hypothetical protein